MYFFYLRCWNILKLYWLSSIITLSASKMVRLSRQHVTLVQIELLKGWILKWLSYDDEQTIGCIETEVRRYKYFREWFKRRRYFWEQMQLEWSVHLHALNKWYRLCILPRCYCQHTVCIEGATAPTSGTDNVGTLGRSPGESILCA